MRFPGARNGEDDQVSDDAFSAGEENFDLVTQFGESFYGLTQKQADAFLQQVLVYVRGDGKIDRGHHLVAHFYDRYFCARVMQVFGHFQPDESGADDDGTGNLAGGDEVFDAVGVFHVASVKIPSVSMPSSGGRTGDAPGERSSLS